MPLAHALENSSAQLKMMLDGKTHELPLPTKGPLHLSSALEVAEAMSRLRSRPRNDVYDQLASHIYTELLQKQEKGVDDGFKAWQTP